MPPSTGPSAAAIPATPPHSPTTLARRSGGNSGSSRASALGTIAAAAAPCTSRAAISAPADGARPAAAEPSTNSATPLRNTRLRPTRSAVRPETASSAANSSA